LALIAIFFVLLIPSQKRGFKKNAEDKNWQCCLQQRPREADIFHVFPLVSAFRQDYQVQHFVSYLNMPGSYCFLFIRCLWSAHLRKILPSIKH